MSFNGINRWHVVISGFLQNEGDPTGMVMIWRKLRALASEHSCVELRSWNDNFANLAELIYRFKPAQGHPTINVYAYSWGGMSAMHFAEELAKRDNMGIENMVLSDPVYRHRYWLGQWRAMMPWSEIVVPQNVKAVWWYKQTNPRFDFRTGSIIPKIQPQGHKLICLSPSTRVNGDRKSCRPILLTNDHNHMDDAQKFRLKCLEVAS